VCPIAQFNLTGDESFDQDVVLDVPIVLGERAGAAIAALSALRRRA